MGLPWSVPAMGVLVILLLSGVFGGPVAGYGSPPAPVAALAGPSAVSLCPAVTTFPGGPSPTAAYPVAVAVDPTRSRIYAVHREILQDVALNAGIAPVDVVSVVDGQSGRVVTTIPVGRSVNGSGQGIAVDSVRNRVFVGNAGDKTVSVIDGATNTVVATTTITTALGATVDNIAVDAARGLVYVAAGNLTILDAASGAVAGTVTMPNGAASAVAVDSSTGLVYVRDGRAALRAVDGQTGTIVRQAALPELLFTWHRLAVDPGAQVYVADYNTGQIVAFNTAGGTLTETQRLAAGMYVDSLAVDPVTRRLFVVDSANYQVRVFDQTGAKLKDIAMLMWPWAIDVDAAARRAYVTHGLTDNLGVVDLDQLVALDSIALGTFNPGVAYDSGRNRIYSANYLADSVAVLDGTSRTLLANWPTEGHHPWAIAVDPGRQQIYSLNLTRDEGSLTILSTVSGTLKAKVNVGATGAGGKVVVSPTSHRVYVTAGNGLTILDGNTNQVVATVPTGDSSIGVDFDEQAGRAYVAVSTSYSANDAIKVVDLNSFQVTATWPQTDTLKGNWDLALDPSLHRLYVTFSSAVIGNPAGLKVLDSDSGAFIARPITQTSTEARAGMVAVNRSTSRVFMVTPALGTLSIVDGASNTLLAEAATGLGPHGLSVDEAANLVYTSNPGDGTISVVNPCLPSPTATATATPTAAASATATATPATGTSATATATALAAATATPTAPSTVSFNLFAPVVTRAFGGGW